MKTPNKFNQDSEKMNVWFDHFQMEFEVHIWWLSRPHEYFEMVEYEHHSSLRDGRTGNRVFLCKYVVIFITIYIGKSNEIFLRHECR